MYKQEVDKKRIDLFINMNDGNIDRYLSINENLDKTHIDLLIIRLPNVLKPNLVKLPNIDYNHVDLLLNIGCGYSLDFIAVNCKLNDNQFKFLVDLGCYIDDLRKNKNLSDKQKALMMLS